MFESGLKQSDENNFDKKKKLLIFFIKAKIQNTSKRKGIFFKEQKCVEKRIPNTSRKI